MMTVRELMERLQQANPDALVVLSRDPEGNRYSVLYQATDGNYEPVDSGYGEVHDPGHTDDAFGPVQPAVILYPSA